MFTKKHTTQKLLLAIFLNLISAADSGSPEY